MRLHTGLPPAVPSGPGATTEAYMIDFSLTDEQWASRELAHDFAAREIRPLSQNGLLAEP
jgi:hypothetical protein